MIIKGSTTKQTVKLIDTFTKIKKNYFKNTVNKIKRQVRLGRNYFKNMNVQRLIQNI